MCYNYEKLNSFTINVFIKTLICIANELTGFCMVGTLVVDELLQGASYTETKGQCLEILAVLQCNLYTNYFISSIYQCLNSKEINH